MSRRLKSIVGTGAAILVAAALGFGLFATRAMWWDRFFPAESDHLARAELPAVLQGEKQTVRLSKQARQNLGLTAKPVRLQDYWRTVQIPGVIVDRPGISDRGVTAPAAGVVEQVHALEGDTVRPGAPLFRLRLISPQLQNAQSELFQASREIELLNEQLQRLRSAAQGGAVAQSRLIELENQVRRQEVLIQTNRQQLRTGGFGPAQVDRAAEGDFITTIEVVAPAAQARDPAGGAQQSDYLPLIADPEGQRIEQADPLTYEVQELKVELGQHIEAGQLLVQLANHRVLYIEGHAFKQESPFLEQAAAEQRAIEVEFAEDAPESWPPLDQKLEIRHLANRIDPVSRTFDFYIPLINQSRTYQKDGMTFLVWRFRPGQRVRLFVPMERYENVIVVPSEAVVREGPAAFVFRQNGDLFDRIEVHILHQDRRSTILAHDGNIAPGLYLAQNSAASLNRVLKSQDADDLPAGVHVHADGTVHSAH